MPTTKFPDMGRLFIVSNRLPITIKRTDDGDFEFVKSSGGLVAGLSGLAKSTPFQWYGWTGPGLTEDDFDHIKDRLEREHKAVPILLDEDLANRHYNDFCNSILWPLFHYSNDFAFDEDAWHAYEDANREFAKAIAQDVEDGDLVWVHDYHLMLLPKMLREEVSPTKDIKIGFFLHTPFPADEIYRRLPRSADLLEGVLGSDVVGFHTPDYARYFLRSCENILGLRPTTNSIDMSGRTIYVDAFPLGIDPDKFREALSTSVVKERMAELKRGFPGKKLIVGVDRLDPIKGVPQKLAAFEVFLSDHPEWIGHVVLVQVAVPSRENVEQYKRLSAKVDGDVGRINGKFGRIEFVPIHFLHQSIPFEELTALYAVSDVCLISSTRDGMNLVAFEYIAAQEARQGTLVLSEFTGASESLKGSLSINPFDLQQQADRIHEALTMGDSQRKANFKTLHDYVNQYTSARWGNKFVSELMTASKHPEDYSGNFANLTGVSGVKDTWDLKGTFDGTKTPINASMTPFVKDYTDDVVPKATVNGIVTTH